MDRRCARASIPVGSTKVSAPRIVAAGARVSPCAATERSGADQAPVVDAGRGGHTAGSGTGLPGAPADLRPWSTGDISATLKSVELLLITGSAGRHLVDALATELGVDETFCHCERFPDGEADVLVGDVRGGDVYVVQPTGPPVDEHTLELLLILDACRRGGASRMTAVLPYLGYGRHDRRTRSGEAIGAWVVGDLLRTCGADRVVLLDPHSASTEGLFAVPVEVASAWTELVEALRHVVAADAVVLAPDEGAVKIADRVATELDRPLAFVRKRRVSGHDVVTGGVTGEVRGRPLLVVDDMISTGATIRAAVGAALDAGATPDVVVAACHGLFVGEGLRQFRELPIRHLFVTDSLPSSRSSPPSTRVVPIARVLARTIRGLRG